MTDEQKIFYKQHNGNDLMASFRGVQDERARILTVHIKTGKGYIDIGQITLEAWNDNEVCKWAIENLLHYYQRSSAQSKS